jgi:hypothetical protein
MFEAKDTSKADFVCSLLAAAHFEADRITPLGYEDVVVLDKEGGQLASCPIK